MAVDKVSAGALLLVVLFERFVQVSAPKTEVGLFVLRWWFAAGALESGLELRRFPFRSGKFLAARRACHSLLRFLAE